MRLTIERGSEEELILRCPDPDAPHIRALLRLLGDAGRRIPARSETELCFLSPADVLYAEYVERGVFLYTADCVYTTPLSLAELEQEGLLRQVDGGAHRGHPQPAEPGERTDSGDAAKWRAGAHLPALRRRAEAGAASGVTRRTTDDKEVLS